MPRPPKSPVYVSMVGTLAEEGKTADEVFIELQRWARDQQHPNDAPGREWVRRRYTAHRKLTDENRREFSLFRWPESMEYGVLPWDASQAGLELLLYCVEHRLGRPTNRMARWFWRVLLACPALDRDDAYYCAGILAAREFLLMHRDYGEIDVPKLELAKAARLYGLRVMGESADEKDRDRGGPIRLEFIVTTLTAGEGFTEGVRDLIEWERFGRRANPATAEGSEIGGK
jgi:hypothetical protein